MSSRQKWLSALAGVASLVFIMSAIDFLYEDKVDVNPSLLPSPIDEVFKVT
jgi:hypothetical protein